MFLLNEVVAACGLSVRGLPGIAISSGGGCYATSEINKELYIASLLDSKGLGLGLGLGVK